MISLPVVPETCKGCGKCCLTVGKPPYSKKELSVMPRELREEVEMYRQYRGAGMICAWLTGKMECLHYEHRPKVCRDFERGSNACVECIFSFGE